MGLSLREQQVLALIEKGLTTQQIAFRLGISRYTVRGHIRRMRAKFGVPRMSDLPTAAATMDLGELHDAF